MKSRIPTVTTITAPMIGNATGTIEPIPDNASFAMLVRPLTSAVVTVVRELAPSTAKRPITIYLLIKFIKIAILY